MRFAASPGALLLTPGAGSDRDHPSLLAIEAAVAPMPVARVDFPYRRAGRKGPDPAPRMVACVIEEAAALAARARVVPERVVLGGRSMGGRMCSMAAAEGHAAAGLVLVAYPLHPPGRPERMRTEHFPAIEVACLFVSAQGTLSPPQASSKRPQLTSPGRSPICGSRRAGHEHRGADDGVAASVAAWLIGGAPDPA
ncbi:MAG: dienelactone hydrolase [Actinomycetota bacterium]|nr:dienelactone hydrolase [Actinomycetota bacterium]